MSSFQPRVAAGAPAGGQFSAQARAEADTALPTDPADRIRALQYQEDDIRRQIFETAVDAISTTVHDRFPTAAYLLLSDEGDGSSHYFAPAGILDADGTPLFGLEGIQQEQRWRGTPDDEVINVIPDHDSDDDFDEEELLEELAEFTPLLDRLGPDAVTLHSDKWFDDWQGIALTR